MVDFFLYTKPHCPYCINAKHYLEEHHYSYNFVDITNNQALIAEVKELSQQATVPQIFDLRNISELHPEIDLDHLTETDRRALFNKANHVGGFSDLDKYIKAYPSFDKKDK